MKTYNLKHCKRCSGEFMLKDDEALRYNKEKPVKAKLKCRCGNSFEIDLKQKKGMV